MADKVINTQGESSRARPRVVNWAELTPQFVGTEDTMSPDKVAAVWENMMRIAGLGQPDEKTRQSFRLAVYVYAMKNGTSREGSYGGTIRMSNGTEFPASVIPKATGQMSIRRFFRGNMTESYEALKASGAGANDERFVAKAASMAITAEAAFAVADWLTDCPHFTNSEKLAHDKNFVNSVARARRARNGMSLEAVEDARLSDNLEVQGPSYKPEPAGFSF